MASARSLITRSQLEDGIQVFLQEISQNILDIFLPRDGEELRVSCRTAARKARARCDAEKEDVFISETETRLVHLKSDVLEPLLCDFLTQQLVGCERGYFVVVRVISFYSMFLSCGVFLADNGLGISRNFKNHFS